MALVMVLVIVSLLMTLVLAMLTMGSSEARSAAAFSQTNHVRSLGEMPSTIVMGQIREATSKLEMTHTWASQPGMIRVFGTDETPIPGRAALKKVWRLYSSPKMTEDGTAFDATMEAGTLSSWSTNPALFTDLNEPVATIRADGSVRKVYPILDENALTTTDGVTKGKMAGFGLASNAGPPGASELHPLPMPVSWLYVLQDGKMIAPVSGTGSTAKFKSGDVTATNPIVGRIAFWADDETCKVNINTASEGTGWDVPRTTSWTDRTFAFYPPGFNEFQRFPGHPAMTCLSTVLQAFDTKYDYQFPRTQAGGTVSNKDAYQSWLKSIYSLTPRINLGNENVSSMGGTVPYKSLAGIPLKRERLFSSIDEFFYGSGYDAPSQQRLPISNDSTINSQDLEMGRFFLTAHSRAPEVNLYNRPRISLWPVQNETGKRTAKDKLMVYCATTSNQLGAFQRATTWDKTSSDTKPWSALSPTEDFQIQGNQTIFCYLQELTKAGAPGFGSSSFDGKYGALNRNQILLNMFDLLRWGVNTRNKRDTPEYFYLTPDNYPGVKGEPAGQGSAAPVVAASTSVETFSHKLKTFGRFPSVVEASIVFMATDIKKKATDPSVPLPPSDGDTNGAQANKMRAFLILQPFAPVAGLPSYTPLLRYRIKGLDSWKVNGQEMGFPADAVNRCWTPGAKDNGRSSPYSGLVEQFHGKTMAPSSGGDETANFPFFSEEIDLSSTTKETFDFTGGPITIETHIVTGPSGAVGESTLVQTSTMDFPSASGWPSPSLRWNLSKMPANTSLDVAKMYMDLDRRLRRTSADTEVSAAWISEYVIVKGDTVRSVVVSAASDSTTKGDYRMLCALREVPSQAFTHHPDYFSTTKAEAQSLRNGAKTSAPHFGRSYVGPGTIFGQQHAWQIAGYDFDSKNKVTKTYGLLKDVQYSDVCQSVGPIKLDGAFNAFDLPGDWDTGSGGFEDGPYVNKPDDNGMTTVGKNGAGYYGRMAGLGQDYTEASSFSPNRQICSAVAFGSLPSGVYSMPSPVNKAVPWQTLLFCPNPPSRSTGAGQEPSEADHWGFKPPRDHLFLDLFWMPVVEPYAISEPFSTAGKVNLNTQIMPFSYIRRDTGLCATLRSLRITALTPDLAYGGGTPAKCYKDVNSSLSYETAHEVNMDETLKGLARRFDAGDIYRSASEICDIFLVPRKIIGRDYPPHDQTAANPTYAQMVNWWNGSLDNQKDAHELTGDNLRESPYNQIYARLTTKSNTFTVHHRVQVLKKARSTAADEWDESMDRMVAETRGSTLIERYIDPNDSQVPNFVANPKQSGALDDYYRFRVILRKTFAP